MLTRTIRAEVTKIYTLRPIWIIAISMFVFISFWAVMFDKMSAFVPKSPLFNSDIDALIDWSVRMSFPFLIVMVVYIVGNEYSSQSIDITFLSQPNRSLIAAVKFVLSILLTAVIALAIIVSVFVLSGNRLELFGEGSGGRAVWSVPVAAALMVGLLQGQTWFLRNNTAAMIVGLLWFFNVESVLLELPVIREVVGPLLLMTNFLSFLTGTAPDYAIWNPNIAGIYFGFVGLAMWIGGVIRLARGDLSVGQ